MCIWSHLLCCNLINKSLLLKCYTQTKAGDYIYSIFALSKIVDDSISTHPRCEAQSQMKSGNVRASGTMRRPMGTRGEPAMQCSVFEDYEGICGDRDTVTLCSALVILSIWLMSYVMHSQLVMALHCIVQYIAGIVMCKYSMELIQLQGPQGGVTVSYCSSPSILYSIIFAFIP